MSEAKRYTVETIYQMAAIPAEARTRFLSELPEMLVVIDAMTSLNEAVGMTVITPKAPIWVDDDKGEATINLQHAKDGADAGSVTFRKPKP